MGDKKTTSKEPDSIESTDSNQLSGHSRSKRRLLISASVVVAGVALGNLPGCGGGGSSSSGGGGGTTTTTTTTAAPGSTTTTTTTVAPSPSPSPSPS